MLFTLVMIGAGLWQVGGPTQARAEQRDQRRLEDLQMLAGYHACLARKSAGADVSCVDNPPISDPENVPYIVDLQKNLVCASFETETIHRGARDRHPNLSADGCLAIAD